MSEADTKPEAVEEQVGISPREGVGAEAASAPTPQLLWDQGTAYDLFMSLNVLHHPDKFGLRASWAAGVRSRLPAEDRETLEEADSLIHVPLDWIYQLPAPKDADSALWALRGLPADQRLPALVFGMGYPEEVSQILKEISERGSWDEGDLAALRPLIRHGEKELIKVRKLPGVLDIWANSAEFGERYLSALSSYRDAFFAEEQRRITPALQEAVDSSQELAGELPLSELLVQLSRGIQFEEEFYKPQIILVPSFWITPLIIINDVSPQSTMIVFGARPADTSLVPGDQVPDVILLGLKALSDPTRLRILRYLTHEDLNQAELARRLRLRAPTVTHHLRALRLAGLVYMILGERDCCTYTARLESIEELCTQINDFLASDLEG